MEEKKFGIYGLYNDMEYRVYSTEDGELYCAGNSPFESQGYTDAANGVGLDTMRVYCETTTREFATEHNIPYLGVQFEEYEGNR